ncbi:hypothetical protein CRM22_011276, partial [Opisthorchis felineus]
MLRDAFYVKAIVFTKKNRLIQNYFVSFLKTDKLGIIDQLRSMKAAISEQEAFMCKRDKEYDTAKDKLTVVEQQLALCEAEKMQLH